MIARVWRGLAKPEYADRYLEHLRTETFPQLAAISGYVRGEILKREIPNGTEFLVVTYWQSIEAIERFAGQDRDAAVVPERVQRWMAEYDRRVRHYDVLA